MQYLNQLPYISSSGVDEKGLIEFEIEGRVERLLGDGVVFVGNMSGTIYLVVGKVVFYDYIPAERAAEGNAFTRLKFKGICVTLC